MYVVITTKGRLMDEYFLGGTMLFQGISAREIRELVKCLEGTEKRYDRGETVCHSGAVIPAMSILKETIFGVIKQF